MAADRAVDRFASAGGDRSPVGRETARGAARAAEPAAPVARPSGWRAILALPLLRRSVILAEIIGQPRSLRGWEE